MIEAFCKRPDGLTEVRRDGKDNNSIVKVIREEYNTCKENELSDEQISNHMKIFSSACWVGI